jgi:hypothetical protein
MWCHIIISPWSTNIEAKTSVTWNRLYLLKYECEVIERVLYYIRTSRTVANFDLSNETCDSFFSDCTDHVRLISIEFASFLFTKHGFPMLECCNVNGWPCFIEISNVSNVSLTMLCSRTLCLLHCNHFDRLLIACSNLVFLGSDYRRLDYAVGFSIVTVRHKMLRRLNIEFHYDLMLEHIDYRSLNTYEI